MLLSSCLPVASVASWRIWPTSDATPTPETPTPPSLLASHPVSSAPEPGSDEALFEAHVRGTPGQFRQLFDRYATRIYAVMRQRGLSEADAQDTVQQTFLRAHQARFDFHQGMQVRPWLWTIAFNLMRDGFRRQATRQRGARKLEETASVVEAQGSDLGPEHKRAVRQAIARLSDAHREVILLHWYEGLSFAEVALVVGASENAVKVRAHRAYGKLRELLSEEDGTPEPSPAPAVAGGPQP